MSDASTATPESKPTLHNQVSLNVQQYEKIYKACLESADRITKLDRERIEIATTLFRQYCRDQVELLRLKGKDAQMDTIDGLVRGLAGGIR